ncbi:MAG: cation:proton antiporter [Burkholderiales bacterium]|nr:cation:proton antiporter [Burkholderiales bacterium]
MHPSTPLLATLAVGLSAAAVLGYIAARLRLPPIVGYLLAGILVGPFTPGFVADTSLAPELAEIGVIFLMFGVGLHFSLADLARAWTVAVPGAVAQILAATALAIFVTHLWGWSFEAGLVFGLALSVASTVVLLRALEAAGTLGTRYGQIAVGWLVMEDLVMVIVLVLLPLFAAIRGGDSEVTWSSAIPDLAVALAKVGAFAVLMFVVGSRVVPIVIDLFEKQKSRELCILVGLTIALGIAYAASALFGVSFALGAFLAGMVLHGSHNGQWVGEELEAFRGTFAVLFFVAVGMAFDPKIVVESPVHLLATLGIIILGKSVAAILIVLALRQPLALGLKIAASLAQIGEFSFILGAMGVSLGLLHVEGQGLILGGALASIVLHPFVCRVASSAAKRLEPKAAPAT